MPSICSGADGACSAACSSPAAAAAASSAARGPGGRRGGERGQPRRVAEVLLLDQVAIERVHVLERRASRPSATNARCGRSQQLDQRAAGESGGDRAEDEIDRGGKRLRGQRQRVERLVRHLRVGEDLPRQIQIRQRPLEHDRRPPERRRARRALQRRARTRPAPLHGRGRRTTAPQLGAAASGVRHDQHRAGALAGAAKREARTSSMPGSRLSCSRW